MKKLKAKTETRTRAVSESRLTRMSVTEKKTKISSASDDSSGRDREKGKIALLGPFKRSNWLLAVPVFAFFLLVYWRTCCTTLFWWDSSEFVTAVATLGIPHPPSFPLYILLGKIFSLLPFFSLPFKLNFLSGVFAALSLSFFAFLFLKLFQTFFSELTGDTKMLFIVLIMTLFVTGLNFAFWMQGVRAEVYSLNGLIFILLFLCGIKYFETDKNGQRNLPWLYLFFFIFGLGMGNHHVTLLSTLPAFIYLYVSHNPGHFLKLRNLLVFLVCFLLGCSIYLYLPFRAINTPALNWGNPVSPVKVVTAALALKSANQIGMTLDYTLLERIKDAWIMIYSQFTMLPFLLSLMGFFFLLRKHLKLFIFFLLLLLGNASTIIILPSEFISTSLDFQGYILPVIFSIAILFGVGILFLLKSINEWLIRSSFSPGFNKSLIFVFSIFFLSVSLLPGITFYRLADLSKNDLACRYGKTVLSPLEKNAVVIIDNPNLYFILSALKFGEGYRRDVAVIDRSLLQAEWNCEQERENYPGLFSSVRADLRGEYLFLSLMTEGLNRNFPVYLEYTERDSDLVNFLSPAGHLYKLGKRVFTSLSPELLKKQRDFESSFYSQKEDKIFQRDVDALRMFVYITYRWGLYYEQKGMFQDALRNFSSALELDSSSSELQAKVEKLKSRLQLAKK
jgi:hypothetical protein